MRISIIVATAENGIIGNGGTLPWRLRSDLARFRALTLGKPVIMGRRTFQSLRKPLDGRDNIVVTRDCAFRAEGAETAPGLPEALALAQAHARRRGTDEVMVIGGGDIYAQALALAHRIYLTRVHATIAGDTSFPALDPADWRLVSSEPLPRGPHDDYEATLEVHERA